MTSSRVLLLPLSNVLGHLTRTFAFAEELLNAEMEVHIATNNNYPNLNQALLDGIITHETTEIPPSSTRLFNPILSYESGIKQDLANMESANKLKQEELELRAKYFNKMLSRDQEIISQVNPDIIVTDYRFTIAALPEFPKNQVFHIANILGYPSLYKRVRGEYTSPLNAANILVPGIKQIEQPGGDPLDDQSKIHWCGPFRWQGWKRFPKDLNTPNRVDIFLCFGSTGQESTMVPWLLNTIPKHFNILMVGDPKKDEQKRENVNLVNMGALEQHILNSKVVCCHGGHGTVMECILHQTPMLIFPNNLEQLEIGRQVEKLGLGMLIRQNDANLNPQYLQKKIDHLITDTAVKQNLEYYSEQLKQQDGPSYAASVILNAS